MAATRARELLILPRLDAPARGSPWIALLDLSLAELPALALGHLSPEIGPFEAGKENAQARGVFTTEAAIIAERQRRIVWLAPSRNEDAAGPALQAEVPEVLPTHADSALQEDHVVPAIQGGRERGIILHKLIEEVLTGETSETELNLMARAEVLIRAMGRLSADEPARGLAPAELAACVARALALPEIFALRSRLLPEVPVYASVSTAEQEEVAAGIADAIAFGDDGTPQVVVDWKTDVAPAPETLEHYREQVRAYLDVTEVERGLIVLATLGVIIPVERRQLFDKRRQDKSKNISFLKRVTVGAEDLLT